MHRHGIRQRHSCTHLVVHLIWATYRRASLLSEDSDDWLRDRFERLARDVDCAILAAGCASDHAHVLARHPAPLSASELVRRLKGGSSYAWNSESSTRGRLAWQLGFWAESVSPSEVPSIARYVREQRAHHAGEIAIEPWQTELS